VFHYLYATYNDKWFYFSNALFAYIIFVLTYFETSVLAINENRFPRLLIIAYLPLFYVFVGELRIVIVAHYVLLLLGVSSIRRNLVRGLTFGENFVAFGINLWYFCYYIESVARNHETSFLAGYNTHNALIFAPVRQFSPFFFTVLTLYSGLHLTSLGSSTLCFHCSVHRSSIWP
jgi:hypothetical protein